MPPGVGHIPSIEQLMGQDKTLKIIKHQRYLQIPPQLILYIFSISTVYIYIYI